ncbi:AbrB family transcriptional regulator [Bacillus sp. UMB0893]|uniref:AbrB family transcriptional regulator n=1 Tax=Bacillus sp. UMB0893 TaxID=2066053 RepID=UPI000C762860|nr:AbrB family transcriptional regulator [Bacillus sp. UMB0893]PLR69549.1 hypothetical protein CYJ36_03690 [Bacillus sp. UMB0893]
MKYSFTKLLETYIVAFLGGFLFYTFQAPLPWILGSMTALILWRSLTNRQLESPVLLSNSGFVILGIYFGLSFTATTFTTVIPYLLPFLFITLLLITFSIINSLLVTRFIAVDKITSVFGTIPGGLSEMVAAGESVKANSSLVVVFQTVRLMTVVFLVPFIVVHLFQPAEAAIALNSQLNKNELSYFYYLWYFLSILAGYFLRHYVPAAFVIGPMAMTAILQITGVPLPGLSHFLIVFAQLTVGTSIGLKMTLKDLKIGGKYCGVYFVLTLLLIGLSFVFGYLLSSLTSLSIQTAVLSLAPGGLVEMVLTAELIGADAAVVSSLQFIRLLFILLFVPSLLKWWFGKSSKAADF